MTVLVLTLTAIVAALTVGFALQQLITFVRDDGAGRRSPGRAPRSHHPDLFDPYSRAA